MSDNIDHADTVGHAQVVEHAAVVQHGPWWRSPVLLSWTWVGVLAMFGFSILFGSLAIWSLSRVVEGRSAKDECVQLYNGQVTLATAQSNVALGTLISAAADTTVTVEVRQSNVRAAVSDMATASLATLQTVRARDDYVKAGRPLPCPVRAL